MGSMRLNVSDQNEQWDEDWDQEEEEEIRYHEEEQEFHNWQIELALEKPDEPIDLTDFNAALSGLAFVVQNFHVRVPFQTNRWRFINRERKKVLVLNAIEKNVTRIFQEFRVQKFAEFVYPNMKSWSNVIYDPLRGLLPVSNRDDIIYTSTSSKRSSSLKKFSLILLTLYKSRKLLQEDVFATKRDVYYANVNDYKTQSNVDMTVNVITAMLQIPRLELRILATSKGLMAGKMSFKSAQGVLVHLENSVNGESVPQDVQGISELRSTAKFVLVVEKDATFQKLLDEGFLFTFRDSILVTGKGMPDLNTRQMVHYLWEHLALPTFLYVDADPFGIEIMFAYRFGSLAMAWTQEETAVPVAQWIGVHAEDFQYVEDQSQISPMGEVDLQKMKSLLARPYVNHADCQNLREKLLDISSSGLKAEIQAFPSPLEYFKEKVEFCQWI